jgi:dihydroorotate dehydrogenase electron transfer subunit
MKPGDPIDILGPLGKGFDIAHSLGYALFIAGGIGIAPLPYLAERLIEKLGSIPGRLLVGAKRAEQIVAIERFKEVGLEVTIYTEDRSLGKRGCVTDNLEQGLKPCLEKRSMVFACGPTGMLATVAERCSALKIPCQVSLDRRMACGVGACQGCAVRASGVSSTSPDRMYKRVCLDGPVFDAEEIMWTWMEEADRCPH